ncbi:MAG TPA: hypothetical protein VG269_13075 [Tepidisphaeraceae bacterium]|nr:hypothetical protein [Tepidisphaeraceae bacterium]
MKSSTTAATVPAGNRFGFFAMRRLRQAVATALVATAVCLWLRARHFALRPDAFDSGWVLGVLVLLLAAYNLRKKLTFLPLGRSSTWLQLHIYLALLSVIAFAAHTHLRLPRGPLEISLACLYLGVAGSGIAGLVLTRVLPVCLSTRGEEVIFERIPQFRRKLRILAEIAVLRSVTEADQTTLSDFYTRRLARFFGEPRNFWLHLFQSQRPRRRLLAELADLDRYLDPAEREIAADLRDLVEVKDDLDYHHTLQATLKGWLFVHLPLTYGLLLVGAVHVVVVHAFRGGA